MPDDRSDFQLGDPEVVIDAERLAAILAGPDGPIAKALAKILARAENGAKRRCPVDTGRLRSSIGTRIEQDGDSGLVGVIGTNVEYAAYVEFGAQGRPPAAFIRGGLDEALAGQSDIVDAS